MSKTYKLKPHGTGWYLEYTWEFSDGKEGSRFLILTNPNQLIFVADMLDKLGYTQED